MYSIMTNLTREGFDATQKADHVFAFCGPICYVIKSRSLLQTGLLDETGKMVYAQTPIKPDLVLAVYSIPQRVVRALPLHGDTWATGNSPLDMVLSDESAV